MIVNISLRNLLRQKRRNIILGIAIAFGVTVMIVASSFSNGITDVMFNKILKYVSGHIAIDFHEKGGIQRQIFRDKEKIEKIIKEVIPKYETKNEAIGVNARAIGNGKSDNIVIVNIDYEDENKLSEETQNELEESFKIIEGRWEDLKRKDIPNPAIIPIEKAKELNVKVGDALRVRFQNIFGQWEAETLTIVGILKNDNMFMSMVMFVDTKNLKKMIGIREFETAPIQINLFNPKEAKILANKLYEKLIPEPIVISGIVQKNNISLSASAIGYKTTSTSIEYLKKSLVIINGDKDKLEDKNWVGISDNTAKKLNINYGDKIKFLYKNKFENKITTLDYEIKFIFKNFTSEDKNIILINEEKLYETYYENLPDDKKFQWSYIPKKDDAIYSHLATEWILLPRSKTTDDFMKKMKDIGKSKYKGTTVDVNSLYESASQILNLEYVLKLITGIAGIIIFSIILVGVVNTLRMTIRERTREIGTIRAIGMQKKDVRNIFILEILFLTFISSVLGILFSILVINILSKITFSTEANPLAILLVKQHLHFVISPVEIFLIVLFVHIITGLAAYFPAKHAANLLPAEALRHYE